MGTCEKQLTSMKKLQAHPTLRCFALIDWACRARDDLMWVLHSFSLADFLFNKPKRLLNSATENCHKPSQTRVL